MNEGSSAVDENDSEEEAMGPMSPQTGNNLTHEEIEEIKCKWLAEQMRLRERLILKDCHDWGQSQGDSNLLPQTLKHIGGVDISYVKDSLDQACAALVVIDFDTLEIVYERCKMVKMKEPYIAGFLAFREVEFFKSLIDELREAKPEYLPQVIMIDGNGLLHYQKFGIACHLGLLIDIPTVGVAKNLLHVDGLSRNNEYVKKVNSLKDRGGYFNLLGDTNFCYGVALKASTNTTKPIYVSQGHKISLDTARWLVVRCSQYRIPEPTRHADIISREFLRKL